MAENQKSTYLKERLHDRLLHVALLILGLVQNELVQMVLEVIGDAGAAVAVVDREVGQLGVTLQVGKRGAPGVRKLSFLR